MSESENIPIAPGIKLENLIDFKGDCIDPLTLAIITESLDYALETSARRLKAAGKIYTELSSNPVLPFVKALRNELQRAPQCFPEGSRVIEPPPPPKAPPKAPKTTVTKATAAELEQVQELIATGGKGMDKEILEKIQKKPELMALVRATTVEQAGKLEKRAEELLEIKKKETKERTLPSTWGEVVKFEGTGKETDLSGEYESPQQLANRLGIKTRGAKPDMVKAFERAGFLVTTNGDTRPIKGETTGFVVKRIAPTPGKYKKTPTQPTEPLPPPEPREVWYERRGKGGVVLGWDWYNPRTQMIDPTKRKVAGVDEPPPPETISETGRTLVPEEPPEAEEQEPSTKELEQIENGEKE